MARSKAYTVAGRVFEKQADLDAAVKEALNSHPLNTPFYDPFLAAVINEHHPEVRAAGEEATGVFQYLDFNGQVARGMDTAARYRGGKVVIARFSPLGTWRDVTVYPWRKSADPRNEIKRALREKLAFHLPHPGRLDRCATKGCSASGRDLEYEHVEPTFDRIAEECLALMSDEEIETRFGYSKFVPGKDEPAHCIPDSHPAVAHLLASHRRNRWTWLCAYHHRNVKAAEPVAQMMELF